jgi:transposase InsO family protein
MAGRDVPMSVRRLVVEVETEGLNVTAFCAEHGISTWFFYELRRRFRAAGGDLAALEPLSRAPRRVANRTAVELEDRIVGLRKELVELGLDAGPATIQFHLRARGEPSTPSESTIWRVLDRRGFIVKEPRKAPKVKGRSFSAERANECWQIDDTTWALADGSEVKIINVVDDCTRVAVASTAVLSCTTAAAVDAFAAAATVWGWPARFLSDNAKAFRHGLADAMAALKITAGHSRPYHPQTCGKVERFHWTLKRYLSAQEPADTIAELQDQLDRFRQLYNHQRPHRSLGRRIPAEVWAATPKDGPAGHPVTTPTEIHRVRVTTNGILPAGRRYSISVGAIHTGKHATVVITGTACHVFIDGQLIRKLTLDPTRHRQPLYAKPGRPRLP